MPQWEAPLRERLIAWGGNSSGVNVANIDNLGTVHPDTMWWHHDLGNVRQRPFSAIWSDTSEPLMAGLKTKPAPGGWALRCATTSASAAATRACVPSNSRAMPGPKTPAATCATTRSGCKAGQRRTARGADAFQQGPPHHRHPPGERTCMTPCAALLQGAAHLALSAGLLWMGHGLAQAQPHNSPSATAAKSAAPTTAASAAALYGEHCASCHGAQRTGGMGPALLP